MAFHLVITEACEQYLENLPLSERAKQSVDDFIAYAIADVSDEDRLVRSIRPSVSVFARDFGLRDMWGDNRWHIITFYVDDSQAVYGKLSIVFVDHADSEFL